MDQFVVPQFIENEPKIIGPITVRQFVLLLIGGFLIAIAYRVSDLPAFIFETLIIGVVVGVFAFFKVNGQPFHLFLLNLIQTLKKPTLRVWRRDVSASQIRAQKSMVAKNLKDKEAKKEQTFISKPKPGAKRLTELSLIVDTGGAYKGEQDIIINKPIN